MFTKKVDNAEDLINTNYFYPIILITTSETIDADLDSADVYSIVHVGFLTIFGNGT